MTMPTGKKKMTKEEFIELTGEDPEDMLGADWENELETMEELKSIEYPIEEKDEMRYEFESNNLV